MKNQIDFAIFVDINSRDGQICNAISEELNRIGYSSQCFPLRDEKDIYKSFVVHVSVINKPHFFMPHRFIQKMKGMRYLVLDTEGILPGENRQHVLLEPEAYVHWFEHQLKRYNFKFTNTIVSGYPRQYFLNKETDKNKDLVSVATNFSILGYSEIEVRNKKKDRLLKLVNDWDLFSYRSFQEDSLNALLDIFANNPKKKFVLKPHPNDPKNLWEKTILPKNVKLFQGEKTIAELFKIQPEMHLCMDGCTTILDAFLSNIPVVTFGQYSPLKYSKLRKLVTFELQEDSKYGLENIEFKTFKKVIKNRLSSKKEFEKFSSELNNFNFHKIISLAEKVYSEKPRFCFYDYPTNYHFIFWIKYFVKRLVKPSSKKSKRMKFGQ